MFAFASYRFASGRDIDLVTPHGRIFRAALRYGTDYYFLTVDLLFLLQTVEITADRVFAFSVDVCVPASAFHGVLRCLIGIIAVVGVPVDDLAVVAVPGPALAAAFTMG